MQGIAKAVASASAPTAFTGVLENPIGSLGHGVCGFSGVGMRCALLLALLPRLLRPPKQCFFSDDLLVTKALRDMGVAIVQHNETREQTKLQHTRFQHDRTSVHAHHASHRFRVNRRCLHALEDVRSWTTHRKRAVSYMHSLR